MSSLLPGSRDGVLRGVTPFDLHGERYYHLLYALAESPERTAEARVAHDAIYDHPQPGDEVRIHSMMGVVTRVEKR
ncbi:MAG: hypothetical protein A3F84_10235 [Candidatus Handelsmanbacteria bacterium RIFCSPLOWO2_12_FULL_64_10]|uniref:Uncharacterized protein n=1 Tax=Handelsmanbacteria sp. (strain RIFCSPLOWO2_12_FULL_64_10) TaxID=1817868 RepID=A0A1F6D479_HANXR|nr:MAG: hypothetical protein A3F84_10235 [Candidatus Handelsmanbacteria bacterium RIFCSPLOWO2_12_FULL_64_10]